MTERNHGTRAGERVGLMGLAMNAVLAGGKMFFGAATGSLSLFTDGVNNVMDCFSSGATYVGLKLSKKPADKEHPYGHHRIEYIVGFIISLLTAYVALEFFQRSIAAILHPKPSDMTAIAQIFLFLSILIKGIYGYKNHRLFQTYGATLFQANRQDAYTDMVMSLAILITSFFFSRYARLDGILTLVISLFLLYSVYHTLRDTIAPLIGAAPSKEDVATIEEALFSEPIVKDIHNLNVDRRSMGQVFATVDVEVDPNLTIQEAHDILEMLTARLRREKNIYLILHMEPAIMDPRQTALRKELLQIPEVVRVNDIVFDVVNSVNIEIGQESLPRQDEIVEKAMKILRKRSDEPWDIDVTVSF